MYKPFDGTKRKHFNNIRLNDRPNVNLHLTVELLWILFFLI